MFVLLMAWAAAMGFAHPPREILYAIEAACHGDEACGLDAVLYAAHESSFQERPAREYSWDAKAHVSCGTWQTPCSSSQTLLDQARTWVALRKYSLDTYGDLRGLAGNTPAGIALTQARELEREDVTFGAQWGVR
jgi:hypothetical protein